MRRKGDISSFRAIEILLTPSAIGRLFLFLQRGCFRERKSLFYVGYIPSNDRKRG
jgi:hypothetical protein